MKRFLLLSLMGIAAVTAGCCGRKKCCDTNCQKDAKSTEQTEEKALLIYRDRLEVRESGPMQPGIEFSNEDLK